MFSVAVASSSTSSSSSVSSLLLVLDEADGVVVDVDGRDGIEN
jgi:hypothetical protein